MGLADVGGEACAADGRDFAVQAVLCTFGLVSICVGACGFPKLEEGIFQDMIGIKGTLDPLGALVALRKLVDAVALSAVDLSTALVPVLALVDVDAVALRVRARRGCGRRDARHARASRPRRAPDEYRARARSSARVSR